MVFLSFSIYFLFLSQISMFVICNGSSKSTRIIAQNLRGLPRRIFRISHWSSWISTKPLSMQTQTQTFSVKPLSKPVSNIFRFEISLTCFRVDNHILPTAQNENAPIYCFSVDTALELSIVVVGRNCSIYVNCILKRGMFYLWEHFTEPFFVSDIDFVVNDFLLNNLLHSLQTF